MSYNKYYFALINIIKSKLLPDNYSPINDIVHWLFVDIEGIKYSFLYDILNDKSDYNTFFKIRIKFFRHDLIKNIIEPNKSYYIYRGKEKIGIIKNIHPCSVGKS